MVQIKYRAEKTTGLEGASNTMCYTLFQGDVPVSHFNSMMGAIKLAEILNDPKVDINLLHIELSQTKRPRIQLFYGETKIAHTYICLFERLLTYLENNHYVIYRKPSQIKCPICNNYIEQSSSNYSSSTSTRSRTTSERISENEKTSSKSQSSSRGYPSRAVSTATGLTIDDEPLSEKSSKDSGVCAHSSATSTSQRRARNSPPKRRRTDVSHPISVNSLHESDEVWQEIPEPKNRATEQVQFECSSGQEFENVSGANLLATPEFLDGDEVSEQRILSIIWDMFASYREYNQRCFNGSTDYTVHRCLSKKQGEFLKAELSQLEKRIIDCELGVLSSSGSSLLITSQCALAVSTIFTYRKNLTFFMAQHKQDCMEDLLEKVKITPSANSLIEIQPD